jgi:hypothetical protein
VLISDRSEPVVGGVQLAKPGAPRGTQAGTAASISPGADISDPATGNAKHVMPSATAGAAQVSGPDGTSVKVGHDVGLATLRRVMTVLRR